MRLDCTATGLLQLILLTKFWTMQLTGELPFEPSDEDEMPVAPDYVHEEDKKRWEEYEAILRLQHKWVSQADPTCLVECLSTMVTTVPRFILAYTYTFVAGMPPRHSAVHKVNSTILQGGKVTAAYLICAMQNVSFTEEQLTSNNISQCGDVQLCHLSIHGRDRCKF